MNHANRPLRPELGRRYPSIVPENAGLPDEEARGERIDVGEKKRSLTGK
jgi:hypothetical protein